MVTNNHYIELYINKELIELESQESLNLRINNVLFNPTKNTTTQAEYSFSFDIPSTPNNDKILNYANNLSQANKFHTRYSSQVYADGDLIFDGSLTIVEYDASKKMYRCNLVNIKINTIEEIFGDMKLIDLKWEVPFNGASTINNVNNDMSSKYFFPFVSYGVFQKHWVTKDEVAADYTPKFDIDKYNRFWIESFYPSLNMMEMLRQAFVQKGYVVGGSAFADPNINNIFCSTNLADEQSPLFNLGNPKFGHLDISTTFSTNGRGVGYQQELNFPYYRVKTVEATGEGINTTTEYNFNTVNLFNAFSGGTTTLNEPSYMYDPNEKVIVIPADGFYKVEMTVDATLDTTGNLDASQWTTDDCIRDLAERDIEGGIPVGFFNNVTPLEVQLVRNYDDNIELIKGKWNTQFNTGNPTQTQRECTFVYDNVTTWETCFPHEDPYSAELPTESNDLQMKNTRSNLGGKRSSNSFGASGLQQDENGNYSSGNDDTSESGNFSGRRGGTRGTSSFGGNRNPFGTSSRKWSYTNLGYVYDDANESSTAGQVRHTNLMCYDQAVSQAFICGVSTMSSGVTAVMKNGYSWSKSEASKNDAFYPEVGYKHVYRTSGTPEQGGGIVVEEDGNGFNKNTYINTPISYTQMSDTAISGYVSCMVWLNKNDVVEPMIVQREYHTEIGNSVLYSTTTNINIKLTAFSDRNYYSIQKDKRNCYCVDDPNSVYHCPESCPSGTCCVNTEFPIDLNLFNFTNKSTKVSDWVKHITTAFNLEISQDGNNIDINTNRGIKKTITNAIELDNRVSSDEVKSEYINYPKEMSVQYKTDIDEYGFECTVPQEHINDVDWYKWGDSGFTIINLSDDSYETTSQNTSTNFSYTWYCPFTWKEVIYDTTSGFVETGTETLISIPVIEKSEYMAEGYGYDEAMKHDGYSFTQRFWYRQQPSNEYVFLSDNMHEQVYLTYPTNSYDGFHLSYKDTEKSIVSEYFNVSPMLSSNYVTLDAYISPQEFLQLKGGALCHFDSDLYYTSEISGFDPSGSNPTTLKLIKKV